MIVPSYIGKVKSKPSTDAAQHLGDISQQQGVKND